MLQRANTVLIEEKTVLYSNSQMQRVISTACKNQVKSPCFSRINDTKMVLQALIYLIIELPGAKIPIIENEFI